MKSGKGFFAGNNYEIIFYDFGNSSYLASNNGCIGIPFLDEGLIFMLIFSADENMSTESLLLGLNMIKRGLPVQANASK